MSQVAEILDYIEAHGSITTAQAWEELKIMRLAARIADLKKAGIEIVTEIHTNGKTRWAEYKKAAPGVQTENGNEAGTLDANPTSKNNTTF